MATSVFSLLTLPSTSKGLSALQPTVVDAVNIDGSASPRRKVARLNTDSDSASASRSRSTTLHKPGASIRIRILDGDGTWDKKPASTEQFALVRHCIKISLTRVGYDILPATYERVYSNCRALVTDYKRGEDLYGALKLELEQSLTALAKAMIEESKEEIDWLGDFAKHCEWFESQIGLVESLLTYLDQVYVIGEPKAIPICELAFTLFTQRIFENPRIAERLRAGISKWVVWERNLKLPHEKRKNVNELIKHLIIHSQYSSFEEYYIQFTRSYYEEDSADCALKLGGDPKGFFKHVITRIQEETERSKDMLVVGSWGPVREATEKALLGIRLKWLAFATLGSYMETNDLASLASMYTLFGRVGGTAVLCAAFRQHIRTSVEEIVKDVNNDDDMVQRLLDLKSAADTTISTAFLRDEVAASESSAGTKNPDPDFIYSLKDAFTSGFRARRNKPAEMIAKFLDRAMRKGQGSSTDTEFQALLDSALALYRYTDDKDVFRTFYHRSLAKRLLLEKSASTDFEASMLKKLKEEYDPEFGMGEDMFKDLALSKEAMAEYHAKLPLTSPGQRLSVMVLQRSAWPFTVQKKSVDLPLSMQKELTNYTNDYKLRHSGHSLSWDHALGTATLKARFDAGFKDLSVSLYQAVVLLLFNDAVEIPFVDIVEQTRMDDGELRRTLQSLACGKKKVLTKIPPGKDVNDGDVFKFNADFKDDRLRVHINSIQAKVTPEESKRTNESIEGDRKHYLDAAIVRIMKAKKEMAHEQLMIATIDAVKSHFVPNVDTIKKRVEAMVEQEYLERSKKDKETFLYVA